MAIKDLLRLNPLPNCPEILCSLLIVGSETFLFLPFNIFLMPLDISFLCLIWGWGIKIRKQKKTDLTFFLLRRLISNIFIDLFILHLFFLFIELILCLLFVIHRYVQKDGDYLQGNNSVNSKYFYTIFRLLLRFGRWTRGRESLENKFQRKRESYAPCMMLTGNSTLIEWEDIFTMWPFKDALDVILIHILSTMHSPL